MTERVQVIVDAKDNASGVLRGITASMGSLGGVVEQLTGTSVNWGNIASAATRLVGDAMKEAFKVATEYAGSVRDLALASGTSAEQASRLLQVLDDFEIQAGDITTATKAMTKNGLAPTIQTIAQLSDQYLQLNTAAERNAFITDNLGRGGAKWANVLKEGSTAILAMNDGINKSLILTDDMIAQYEEMRLNQDEFNDNIMAIKVSLVNAFVPAINDSIDALQRFQQSQTNLEESGVSAYTAHRLAIMGVGQSLDETKSSVDEANDAFWRQTYAFEATSAAAQTVQTDYKGLITDIQNMTNETQRYEDKNVELGEKTLELKDTQSELIKELATLKEQGWWDESDKVLDTKKKLDDVNKSLLENQGDLDANAEAHKRWAAQTVFSFAQAKAAADGSITEGEGEILIDMGVQLGLFDQKTAETMDSVNKAFDNVDTENAQEVIDALKRQMELLTGEPWVIQIEATTPVLPTPPVNSPPPLSGGTSVEMPVRANGGNDGGRMVTSGAASGAQSQVNYFYGPATLLVSENGVGDVLGVR